MVEDGAPNVHLDTRNGRRWNPNLHLGPRNGHKNCENGPRTAQILQNDTHRAEMRPRVRFRYRKESPGYENTAHLGVENCPKIDENRCQNMKGFRTRFHGPFVPHFLPNLCQNQALEADNGSQNGIDSKKRVFNSNQGVVYENHDFGSSRAPALKTKRANSQPKTEFDFDLDFL